jgi:hypothetical protein
MLERLASVPSASHIDARWQPFALAPGKAPHTLAVTVSLAKPAVPFGIARAAQRRPRANFPWRGRLQSQNHSFGGHDGVREQTPSLLGDPVEHVVRVVRVVVEDDELFGVRGNG